MAGFGCEDLPKIVRPGIFEVLPARLDEEILLHPVQIVSASTLEAHDFHQHAVVDEAVKDLSDVGPVIHGVSISVVVVTRGFPVLESRQ